VPRISVHLGVTIPGEREYTSLRPDVTFSDIDTEGDVETQLSDCLAVYERVEQVAEKVLAQGLANTSGLSIEGLGLGAAFAAYKEKMKAWQENVVGELRRQKSIIDQNVLTGALGASEDQINTSAPDPVKVKKAKK